MRPGTVASALHIRVLALLARLANKLVWEAGMMWRLHLVNCEVAHYNSLGTKPQAKRKQADMVIKVLPKATFGVGCQGV
jgi:hypothetical protein